MATKQPKSNRREIERLAVQRLIKSEDGKYLVSYLADLALNNLGVPCENAYEYAYNEGKRSIFLAVLQLAEQNAGEYVYNMVKGEGWY